MNPVEFGKVLVLSPHLDDAVLGCGTFIYQYRNANVATIFAGTPANTSIYTIWDALCGFTNAHDAMICRREEDLQALSLLHAKPIWLSFLDKQYDGEIPLIGSVASAIAELIKHSGADTILFPAGLRHPDHVLVHRASLIVLTDYGEKSWLMYEDALYRRIPGLLQRRLTNLLDQEIMVTPLNMGTQQDAAAIAKREAVLCYASQLPALKQSHRQNYDDVFAQERIWRVQDLVAHHKKIL